MMKILQSHGFAKEKDLFLFVDEIGGHDEDAWKYHFELLLLKFV